MMFNKYFIIWRLTDEILKAIDKNECINIRSGGREHAFAWKISQSSMCKKLLIASGNAGTAQVGVNINIGVNEFEEIKKLCIKEEINMIIVTLKIRSSMEFMTSLITRKTRTYFSYWSV